MWGFEPELTDSSQKHALAQGKIIPPCPPEVQQVSRLLPKPVAAGEDVIPPCSLLLTVPVWRRLEVKS